MLMGPASLAKDQDPDISLSAKCNGMIWNVTSVTPGIIAFAAILVRGSAREDSRTDTAEDRTLDSLRSFPG